MFKAPSLPCEECVYSCSILQVLKALFIYQPEILFSDLFDDAVRYRKMIGLLLALALQAAVLQTSYAVGDANNAPPAAPSCDIKDLDCIAKDFKASLQKNPSTFEDEYQQFAEMIAPVLLLAHGGNFEVKHLFTTLQPCHQAFRAQVGLAVGRQARVSWRCLICASVQASM